jgi:hypothetical protein
MTAARDCVRLAPKEPRVYRTMAWIQARERRDGGAFLTRQTDVFLDAIDVPDELEQRLGAAQAVDDVAAILAVAEDHRRHRRPRVALDIALEALRQAPGDPDVHLAIARARLALGMRGRALDDLDRLARLLAMRDDADGLDRLGSFVQDEVLRPHRVAWGPT